jgi:hypothetical protein
MQAHGSDRLRVAADGSLELASRLPKREWHPRTTKTMTRNERPGTAVLWDEECYEVVDATPLAQGMRYTLRPWSDGEAMRVTTRYDDATEAAREAERRDSIRREKQRQTANAFAFITGHLPGAVQERLGHEIGVDPARLTMWSTLPPYAALIAAALVNVSHILKQEPMLPLWVNLALGYLFLESSFRFKSAWLSRHAMGSVIGVVMYAIYCAVTPHRHARAAPAARRPGEAAPIVVSPEDALSSAFHMREPLLTLLDVRDQELLRERFAFDYRRTASSTAAIILVVTLIGIASSIHTLLTTPRFSALTALFVAIALAGEQLWRLAQLPRRPAPSLLRFAIRPLAKTLLT